MKHTVEELETSIDNLITKQKQLQAQNDNLEQYTRTEQRRH